MTHRDDQHRTTWREPIPTNEERAARAIESERRAERDRLWDLLRTAGWCAFWCCAGLFGIALGLHSTDLGTGTIWFYGGLAIGNAGMLLTIHAAYVRARERGDIE